MNTTAPGASAPYTYDVEHIRALFPALHQEMRGGWPLVYLDNAASTQKPQSVIDRLTAYYTREHSNVHRGVYRLSQQATDAYEGARARIARFINANHSHEVVFTRGTTEAINIVASSFGKRHLQEHDEVLVSAMEHHSNLVPWQMVCQEQGATLRILPINDDGELVLEALDGLLTERTRLVSLVHVSNSLGTINPVRTVIAAAHARGIPVLLDGAQATLHMPIDVQELDCDFYCFSGHKVFGPTGIGVLYGKEAMLEDLPPFQGGGDMIEHVSYEKSVYAGLPYKFEAGTPHIAGVVGLAAALDTLEHIGLSAVEAYEQELVAYGRNALQEVEGIRMVGTAKEKAGVFSFLLGDASPYDVGRLLDERGIAVRTGHHCTMPVMDRLGVPGTVRASLALYNTRDEIDALVEALHVVRERFIAMRQRGRTARPISTAVDNGSVTIAERRHQIIEEFNFFDDIDDKREHLMELGEALPPYDELWKTDTHLVNGCLSKVWFRTEARTGRAYFHADSNTMITKGMVALFVRLLSGQAPEAILATDLDAFLADLGMQDLVSGRRKNGLEAMIHRVRYDTRVVAHTCENNDA